MLPVTPKNMVWLADAKRIKGSIKQMDIVPGNIVLLDLKEDISPGAYAALVRAFREYHPTNHLIVLPKGATLETVDPTDLIETVKKLRSGKPINPAPKEKKKSVLGL